MERIAISRTVTAVLVVVLVVVASLAYLLISSQSSTTSTSSGLVNFTYGYGGQLKGQFDGQMLAVAQDLGTWKKYGLNVTIVSFPGGHGPLVAAMQANALNVGDTDPFSLINDVTSGVPIKSFGAELAKQGYAITVPANSSVKSLSQIKGTKFSIGVTTINSGAYNYAKLIMTSAGMEENKDYVIVATGSFAAQNAALLQGKVQSVCTPLVAALGLENTLHVGLRFIANSTSVLPSPWQDYFFIARTDFMQQHPDQLKSFQKGYVDAVNYYNNNPSWSLTWIKSFYGVNDTLAQQIYNFSKSVFLTDTKINPQALQTIADFGKRSGLIANLTKIAAISDMYSDLS